MSLAIFLCIVLLLVVSGPISLHAHAHPLDHISIQCPKHGMPRVRREWRTLSPAKHARVVNAMWTMRNLTTAEGQKKYGPNFVSYEDIVVQHACTNLDPRCDQGHFGPIFIIFHRAMLLLYENSLLAIDPLIEAMPYWNMQFDASNGTYRHDPDKYIFSENFFGSMRGDPDNGFALSDGQFAFWPVSLFNSSKHAADSPRTDLKCLQQGWINPAPASVCRRCCGSTDPSCKCDQDDDVFDRFLRAHDECMPHTVRNYEQFKMMDGSRELLFTEDDFNKCTDPSLIRNFPQWQRCIELDRSACFFPLGSIDVSKIPTLPGDAEGLDHKLRTLAYLSLENQTCGQQGYYDDPNSDGIIELNAHHSQTHFKIAGDMKDPTTSPNDPIFNSFHADIDRNVMTWMARTPFLEREYWNFPKHVDDVKSDAKAALSGPFNVFQLMYCAGTEASRVKFQEYTPFAHAWTPGTTLDDVINAGCPFSNLFNETCRTEPYTVREIIEKSTMSTTIYTYDTMEHLYKHCEAVTNDMETCS